MSYRRESGLPLVLLGVLTRRHQTNSVICYQKHSVFEVRSRTVSSFAVSREFSAFHIPSRLVTQSFAEVMQSETVSPLKRWRVLSSSVYAVNWNSALNEEENPVN